MGGISEGRRSPWGLVGMLVLVASIECLVARHRVDLTDTATMSWVWSGEAARDEGARGEILLAGDSLAKHGLLPGVIEGRTGRRAYNLAAAGAPASTTYFLLKRAFDSGARPTALVVDFMPSLQAGRPDYQIRSWQEFLSAGELLDLAITYRNPGFLGPTAVGWVLPSVRARHEIRSAILAGFRGQVEPRPENNRVARRNWTLNLGANVAARNPAYLGDVSPRVHRNLMSDGWATERVNRTYIRRILQLTAERGVPLYWLIPPISPGVQDRRDRSGSDAKHSDFVRALQAEFPHLVVLDGRRSRYEADLFVDPIHLDHRGASTLSADVADVLDARLSGRAPHGPPWVVLPRYRDVAIGVRLEDLEESRLALRARSGDVRR